MINEDDEFCTFCNADLNKQKGYSNELNYWICKSCGTLLTNPNVPELDNESGIVWICDRCEGCLNVQKGFTEKHKVWKCLECGHENKIDSCEVYETSEEYEMDKNNPTKGMSDEDVMSLMCYREVSQEDIEKMHYHIAEVFKNSSGTLNKVSLVQNIDDGKIYVKKILENYDTEVYRMLKQSPVDGMPKIIDIFEGDIHLVVIEELINGSTIEEKLKNGPLSERKTGDIVVKLCRIVNELHYMNPAIIHRDIKPSNVMLKDNGDVVLLDVDAAKRYSDSTNQDTVLLGTKDYAAPEQYGFGASSIRTDIYAIGVLMNEMLTGCVLKDKRADGIYADIITKCTMMDPRDRFGSVNEIIDMIMLNS